MVVIVVNVLGQDDQWDTKRYHTDLHLMSCSCRKEIFVSPSGVLKERIEAIIF